MILTKSELFPIHCSFSLPIYLTQPHCIEQRSPNQFSLSNTYLFHSLPPKLVIIKLTSRSNSGYIDEYIRTRIYTAGVFRTSRRAWAIPTALERVQFLVRVRSSWHVIGMQSSFRSDTAIILIETNGGLCYIA